MNSNNNNNSNILLTGLSPFRSGVVVVVVEVKTVSNIILKFLIILQTVILYVRLEILETDWWR